MPEPFIEPSFEVFNENIDDKIATQSPEVSVAAGRSIGQQVVRETVVFDTDEQDGGEEIDLDEAPEVINKHIHFSADPVKDYLKKIGQYPLLDAEQEVSLSRSIEAGLFAHERRDLAENIFSPEHIRELKTLEHEGDVAKQIMLQSNLRLVVSLAKRYTGVTDSLKFLDLIQEGNLGLTRAVEKFDFKKGFKFSTYATWWIRQSIARSIGDTDREIRVPVHMHEKITKMNRRRIEMVTELGREPTTSELAEDLDISEEEYVERVGYARKPYSLNIKMGED